MSLSPLPLSYCTNVHPGRSLAEVQQGLDDYAVPIQNRYGEPLAAGLWLAQPVVRELLVRSGKTSQFAEGLTQRGLCCHTLNAFPFGDFHSARVKENVYLPDWSEPERLAYTIGCAEVLAALLPEGAEGSISTVPLGFKGFARRADFRARSIQALQDLSCALDRLHSETGKLIRLAIEPEPFCVLETTAEAISFFAELWDRSAQGNLIELVQRHMGLCYDVCHQAVEFEDVPASIAALEQAGIRINKLHITCAIELERPAENPEARKALARYVEPRYLHQTLVRSRSGRLLRASDLSTELALAPPDDFLDAESWRVHFHVPVNAERLGPLGTTRPQLEQAIRAVAALEYAPHLEVETYTWEVLPGNPGRNAEELIRGFADELTATRKLLSAS